MPSFKMRSARVAVIFSLLLCLCLSSPAVQVGLRSTEGQHIPLTRVHATGNITGTHADIELLQEYQNVFSESLVVEYTFPLDDLGAVYALDVELGDQTFSSTLMSKKQVRPP